MSTIAEVRAALTATLTAAGVRATPEPRDVNPGCVLIGRADGTRITQYAFEGTVEVTVIAPGPGHGDAAAWLDATTTIVAGLLIAQDWTRDTYPTANGALLCDVLTVPAVWDAPIP